jgi:hypothetical protein
MKLYFLLVGKNFTIKNVPFFFKDAREDNEHPGVQKDIKAQFSRVG